MLSNINFSKVTTKITVCIISFTALISCAQNPLEQAKSIEQIANKHWAQKVSVPTAVNIGWQDFQDTYLQQLINTALTDNLEIKSALANIASSRVQLADNHARQGINYSVTGIASTTENRLHARSSNYSLSAIASYEIDLWGSVADSISISEIAVQNTEVNMQAMQISLVAEISDAYFTLRAIDKQLKIRHQILVNNQKLLRFNQARYEMGFIIGIDVKQQALNIQSLEYAIDNLKFSRTRQQQRLSILTGKKPVELQVLPVDNIDIPLLRLSPNTPVDILRNRPDIKAQELALASSYLNFDIARKAFYPKINLTAESRVNNTSFSEFLQGNLFNWNMGINLISVLLDNGSRDRAIESNRILAEQQILNYEKTLYRAMEEVENALMAQETSIREININNEQLSIQNRLTQETLSKYKVGIASGEELLTQENQWLNSQETQVLRHLGAVKSSIAILRITGVSPHFVEKSNVNT